MAGEILSQVGGAQAGVGPLRSGEHQEQLDIPGRHQIEAAPRALAVTSGASDPVEVLPRDLGVVDGGDERQVTLVDVGHASGQITQAVDRLAQGGELAQPTNVTGAPGSSMPSTRTAA